LHKHRHHISAVVPWRFQSSQVLLLPNTITGSGRFLISTEVKGHVTLADKTTWYTVSLEMSRFWKVPDAEKNWKRHEWKIPFLASCSFLPAKERLVTSCQKKYHF
jgi:hypothetical protein